MKFMKFLTAIIIVIYLTSPSTGYDVDLYKPFEGLKKRLDVIQPLRIDILLTGVFKLLGCLLPGPALLFAESELLSIPESRLDLPTNLTDKIKEYFQTPDFAELHKFVWTEPHWIDLLHFLHNYGFKNANDIYAMFIDKYIYFEAPSNLEPALPTEPPTAPPRTIPRNSMSNPLPPTSIWSLSSILEDALANCSTEKWGEIIQDISTSQGIQWFELLQFVFTQINTNPAVQIAWAKISEPEKGKSFRAFTELEPTIRLVDDLDMKVKNWGLVDLILSLIEGLTGIDFEGMNINLVRNLISIVEYNIWGTPFPGVGPLPANY